MSFKTYIPADKLKPFVKSFAIQEVTDKQAYNVLPGTSIVAGFQYKGSLSYINNDKEIKLASAGITGLRDTYRIFTNSAGIGTVLVNFTETGAGYFFKLPMHELFNGSFSLDDLIPHSQNKMVEEQLALACNDDERIQVVENFLLSRLTFTGPDLLVLSAVELIKKNTGLRITELSEHLNISQSQLEKRFRKIVGATPKKFSSIVRFQNITNGFAKADSLTSLAYDAGYFDQAHFIKDFKSFSGQLPEQFLKSVSSGNL